MAICIDKFLRDVDHLRKRLTWLERGFSLQLGIDLGALRTGSDLGWYFNGRSISQHMECDFPSDTGSTSKLDDSIRKLQPGARQSPHASHSTEISVDVTPDISLLTLNATGEMRYLGPSSGSFFSIFASNFARASTHTEIEPEDKSRRHAMGVENALRDRIMGTSNPANVSSLLTKTISEFLLRLFFKWVHTLWPLLDDTYQASVLEPLCEAGRREVFASGTYLERISLGTFYLVLALGALHVNSEHAGNELRGFYEYEKTCSNGALSPDVIFIEALKAIDSMPQTLQPSIPMIQILLLICIYGAYKPSGNRQWQLAGIVIRTAVEIGLHRQRYDWKFSSDELDLRRRVFWTAYAVELTVSFNLGRPPSIPDEHIDADFPKETPEIALGLHHIRHRQIQSKILSQVYRTPHQLTLLDTTEKLRIILRIQDSLDKWKAELSEIYINAQSPYPCKYWERFYYTTTAAIHRPTPLISNPPVDSVNRCLRAAGQYIEIHHQLLKSDKVPQSWMLLQGMLLAGITMIVTARTHSSLFPEKIQCSVCDIMEWTRKCSVVLNIMSERWSDKSISDFEAKFSSLANDTLKRLMTPNTIGSERMSLREESSLAPSQSPFVDLDLSSTPRVTLAGAHNQTARSDASEWTSEDLSGEHRFEGGIGVEDINMIEGLDSVFSSSGSMDLFPLETFYGDNLFTPWGMHALQEDNALYFNTN